MLKTYDVKLDLENRLYSPMQTLFEVSMEDFDTVAVAFSILQDGNPFDLTGTTIELAIKKPSGLTVYQACEIADALAGTVTTLLSTQAYAEYGIYTAEIYIRTIDQIAVTCPFWYSAREGILQDDTLESINDWSALQEALLGFDKKPVLIDAVPDFVPEYIGQTALDTVGRRAFIAMRLAADGWQVLGAAEGGGGLVAWGDILAKPLVFRADLTEANLAAALAAKANIADIPDLTPYITEAEADTKYQAAGTAPNLTGYLTETDAAATYQPKGTYLTAIPAEFLTEAEGDARYLQDVPPEYMTETESDLRYEFKGDGLSQAEADARYQQLGTDTPEAWADITGKPLVFPPSAHTHTSTDITDFAAAVAADIPAEYLTQTEGDTRYALRDAAGGTVQPVDWGQITGTLANQTDLQNALNAKADDTDLANYAPAVHTHITADITDFAAGVAANIPAEYVTTTEADATYQAIGDYITAVEADAAYQPKGNYLLSVAWADVTGKPTTFAPSAHTHASGDITDFAAAVAAAIPLEYLTSTEGNAAYQPKGTYLTAVTWNDVTGKPTTFPAAWADVTGKPTTFAPSAHTHLWVDITNKPTTFTPSAHTHLWADLTDKPTTFAPSAHSHAIADVTNLQSSLDAKAPLASPALTGTPTAPTAAAATNTDQLATTKFVQQQGYLKTVPLMSGAAVGGAQVGNGLAMSGNYLYAKTGSGLGINTTDNSLQVQTSNTTPTPLKFWTGTQATYDGLTKDANTLYFITG